MVVVNNRLDFMTMFDQQGMPRRPFRVADGVWISLDSDIVSLVGVMLGKDVRLYGLNPAVTYDPSLFEIGVELYTEMIPPLSRYTSMYSLCNHSWVFDKRCDGKGWLDKLVNKVCGVMSTELVRIHPAVI